MYILPHTHHTVSIFTCVSFTFMLMKNTSCMIEFICILKHGTWEKLASGLPQRSTGSPQKVNIYCIFRPTSGEYYWRELTMMENNQRIDFTSVLILIKVLMDKWRNQTRRETFCLPKNYSWIIISVMSVLYRVDVNVELLLLFNVRIVGFIQPWEHVEKMKWEKTRDTAYYPPGFHII